MAVVEHRYIRTPTRELAIVYQASGSTTWVARCATHTHDSMGTYTTSYTEVKTIC